jgi:hypothetical protein
MAKDLILKVLYRYALKALLLPLLLYNEAADIKVLIN